MRMLDDDLLLVAACALIAINAFVVHRQERGRPYGRPTRQALVTV
jgi:hypothetical protein